MSPPIGNALRLERQILAIEVYGLSVDSEFLRHLAPGRGERCLSNCKGKFVVRQAVFHLIRLSLAVGASNFLHNDPIDDEKAE